MKPTKTIWMDGRFVPWAKASTHVLTHSMHYGAAANDFFIHYPWRTRSLQALVNGVLK